MDYTQDLGAPVGPVPRLLADELSALMVGKGRDDLVFTNLRGGVLRNSNWRARVFDPAVTRCQKADESFPSITPNDLRHTAASLAISTGANVKAVQRMLGHAKASMTLAVRTASCALCGCVRRSVRAARCASRSRRRPRVSVRHCALSSAHDSDSDLPGPQWTRTVLTGTIVGQRCSSPA
jgi:hypothetical protein